LATSPSFRKKGKVSLWVGVCKPNLKAMKGVDILKDLCGVGYYDLDDQEISAVNDRFPPAPLAEILGRLSYSSSFIDAALQVAEEKKIHQAYWALAQFDFAYDRRRVRVDVAAAPMFLGVFDWNDSEDEQE
jgi:hypothetical protein